MPMTLLMALGRSSRLLRQHLSLTRRGAGGVLRETGVREIDKSQQQKRARLLRRFNYFKTLSLKNSSVI